MAQRRSITAAELHAELANNPAHLARQKEIARKLQEGATRDREIEAELLQELCQLGVPVSTVWDLVNSPRDYTDVIPILTAHLSRSYPVGTMEGLVRALTVPAAKRSEVSSALIHLFRTTPSNHLRWVVGNALATTACTGDEAALRGLLAESKYGAARSELLLGLARLEGRDAGPYIAQFLEDDELRAVAIEAMGVAGAPEYCDRLRLYLSDQDAWIRAKAKAAMKKLRC